MGVNREPLDWEVADKTESDRSLLKTGGDTTGCTPNIHSQIDKSLPEGTGSQEEEGLWTVWPSDLTLRAPVVDSHSTSWGLALVSGCVARVQ